MKTFVLGDIHGAYKALLQCLERSKFNNDEDTLIVIGDVCDGYSQTKEAIEHLLTIKDLIFIKGNHDVWLENWIINGTKDWLWVTQGGTATIANYGWQDDVPESHLKLIADAPIYYIDDKNRIFVHGGISKIAPVGATASTQEGQEFIMWDRDLFYFMQKQHSKTSPKKYTQYNEIFIGHTATKSLKPEHVCNMWNLDTGAGWNGYLTIMDVNTKEYWQSDRVMDLYPEGHARRLI